MLEQRKEESLGMAFLGYVGLAMVIVLVAPLAAGYSLLTSRVPMFIVALAALAFWLLYLR